MKKLLLPLSILIAQTAFADIDAANLKSQLISKVWQGPYSVEYYSSVVNETTGKDVFFYKSSENVYPFPGSDMTLAFTEKNGLLVYEWDREVLGSGESDDKSCDSKKVTKKVKGKLKEVEVGKALPRIIVFKSDLYAQIDQKIPVAVAPDKNAEAKGKVDMLFAGVQMKLKLRDPIVALIKGTSCSEGQKGTPEATTPLADLGDITVPVIKIELSADGQHVDIIASLGTQDENGYPNVMGYSTYSMDKK